MFTGLCNHLWLAVLKLDGAVEIESSAKKKAISCSFIASLGELYL